MVEQLTLAVGRRVPAGQIRLGMRLAHGGVVTAIVRPHRDTVKRGYGRVWIACDDSTRGWAYYPHDELALHPDDDQPLDHTMDDWPGCWWVVAVPTDHEDPT